MSRGKRMATREDMKQIKKDKRRRKRQKSRRYGPTTITRIETHSKRKRTRRQAPNKTKTATTRKPVQSRNKVAKTRKPMPPRKQTTKTVTTRPQTAKTKTARKTQTSSRTRPSNNKVQKRKLNKFKVFIALLIMILIIATPIYLIISHSSKKTQEAIQMEEQQTAEQPEISQEPSPEPTVEPEEDENIKALVQNVIAEKELSENSFEFFYYNINTQKYYFYNEDKYMTAASSIKMPLAMAYYDKINAGKISLDDKITYTKDSYEPGAGATASMYKVGSKVPVKYLIEQSIVNSDNTATNILINNIGYEEYRLEVAEYSTDEQELPEEFYEGNITSAKYGYDVCNHLYNNMDKYQGLIELLKQSSGGSYLKKYLTQTEVAHKYGSYEGYTHDYGIVFGKNTYLIGIFTKGLKDPEEFIAQLSLQVYEQEEEQKEIQLKIEEAPTTEATVETTEAPIATEKITKAE